MPHKSGNPYRKRKQRNTVRFPRVEPLERARLTLHTHDPITGQEDVLSSLFYECYRGYTIYSTKQGTCCIHGKEGCLRIQGKYACFPDVEQAKNLIKHFQADGRTPQECMNRYRAADDNVGRNCLRHI